jgi:hypothetical protein
MNLTWQSGDAFLRAEPAEQRRWVREQPQGLVRLCVVAVVLGAGVYGMVMGSWSSALQAVYTGIKLPLVILLTTAGNGLLNGMVAPLLGLNISFRESLAVVLMTFGIAAAVLGALSPVALFFVWNAPPLTAATNMTSPEYQRMQLALAVFVAFAGVVGNLHLVPMLREWTRSLAVTRNVLLAWLAGNLLLGSQICWVLRPFIWEPGGNEQFIGKGYLRGSFYETVFEAVRHLWF